MFQSAIIDKCAFAACGKESEYLCFVLIFIPNCNICITIETNYRVKLEMYRSSHVKMKDHEMHSDSPETFQCRWCILTHFWESNENPNAKWNHFIFHLISLRKNAQIFFARKKVLKNSPMTTMAHIKYIPFSPYVSIWSNGHINRRIFLLNFFHLVLKKYQNRFWTQYELFRKRPAQWPLNYFFVFFLSNFETLSPNSFKLTRKN